LVGTPRARKLIASTALPPRRRASMRITSQLRTADRICRSRSRPFSVWSMRKSIIVRSRACASAHANASWPAAEQAAIVPAGLLRYALEDAGMGCSSSTTRRNGTDRAEEPLL
jgi:hypothetical protein